MKKIVLTLIGVIAFYIYESNAQVLRAFTPRYYNASVRGNIVYAANNIISSTGGITTEAPPGGTSVNNGKPAFYLDIDNPAPAVNILGASGADRCHPSPKEPGLQAGGRS